MNDVRLDTNFVDYLIVASYFVVVLGVGFAAKRYIKSSLDYFLSGRSLPAWITGLAFISANLGAQEVIGMGASGAKYGIATSHFYWIGAIPAMVFTALSFVYSLVDEVFHWRRYISQRSDTVEMWSHVGILVGHATMMLAWWRFYDLGYPGVRDTLTALGG